MSGAPRTVADYAAALGALLPRGRVWPREPGSVVQQSLASLAPTPQKAATRAFGLLTDAFPATTTELLPEWEYTLGLPDPCAGESPTIELRRAQVVARFTAGGGQSISYFVDLAATLGYAITIEQFAPARADVLRADDPVYDPSWAFAWQVNAPEFSISYFSADVSYADDPLESWGNTVLQCEMQRLAPAHTIILFNYVATGTPGDFILGSSILGGPDLLPS